MEEMEQEKIFCSSSSVHYDGLMTAPPVSRGVSLEEEYKTDGELKSPSVTNESVKVIPYNLKALYRNEPTYKLETFEKNYLIIFNQESIIGYKKRDGTQKDVDALKGTFEKYGFEVDVHKDLTKAEIFKELNIFKYKDFTDYGCVAIAILTHGTYNGILRAKDQQYSELEILNYFKTNDKPTLITKPKMLIIQACRGTRLTRGVFALQMAKIHKDLDDEQGPYTLPLEADTLVLHSSYTGKPSHRVDLHGSWFIQALCKEIGRLSPMDVESIMTEVKRVVAIDMEHEEFNRVTGEMDINKQMPVMTSTLIRKLHLKPYEDGAVTLTYCDGEVFKPENEILDITLPDTPLSPIGPCLCFLPHFTYLKDCLRHFHNENNEDGTAKTYLEICETFEDIPQFNAAKEKMVIAISQHLEKKVPEIEYLKYLYLYKK